MAKNTNWLLIGLVAVLAWFLISGGMGDDEPATGGTTTGAGGTALDVGCSTTPAVSYAVVDKFLNTAVTVTPNIKENGFAPVSALSGPTPGSKLEYWGNASTYFVKPVKHTTICGANPQVQAMGYKNGTLTLTAFDSSYNALTSGGGANNITVAANDNQAFEVRYDGTKNEANMPFGGCLIVEVPTTITGVAIDGLTAGCPYGVTYSVSAVTNTYKMFTIPDGYDADGTGAIKTISGTLTSGTSNPVGTAKFTFIPANYYLANDGNFVLDIEKTANSDSTRTMLSTPAFTVGLT